MFTPLCTLATVDGLTRQVFGNIPASSKLLFYVLALLAVLIFSFGVFRRARLWQMGRGKFRPFRLTVSMRRFVWDVLFQRRVPGRGLASLGHLLLFYGFVLLLIGTTLIAVEHLLASVLGRDASHPVFHKGLYFAVFELVMDVAGLALLLGCLLLALRRVRRPASVSHNALDWLVIASLFAAGATGYLLEGLRILREQTPQPGYSFAGMLAARVFETVDVSQENVSWLHFGMWWLHALLTLALIAAFPYTRLLHSLAGALNLVTAERQPLGAMRLVSMEEVEQTGTVGVGAIQDFDRRQLLELDACVSCGRCEEACPAHEAGKPLSPKALVQDIRGNLNASGARLLSTAQSASPLPSLHGQVISAETLWSCTACSACVDVCPLGVRPWDLISDLRRFLISEGQLRGSPAMSLQKMHRSGNPWGLPAEDRLSWAEGCEVPTVADNPDFEVLYWVGCAASYDRRIQKVAQSMAWLLNKAGVNYAVLGAQERCTGESARRMGDEFLFQELAGGNIDTLNRHRVKKILTHCPHCLNSLQQDYTQLGGHYECVHHSQFLIELLGSGRLAVDRHQEHPRMTYHDPCYLARVGGVSEAPRALLQTITRGSAGRQPIEMRRNRCHTACCGAGGGRMWFDDAPADRIGTSRVDEALATGAETVAVGCPFCLLMMGDGVAAKDQGVQVRDVAEVLVEAIGGQ